MTTTDVAAPAVSIIITAYNYGRFVGRAIESALSQSFVDLELIVLNNASTDDTDAVVRRYLGDPRLRYIVQPTNIGAHRNAEHGLREARGGFVLFLSADDFLQPGHLSTLMAALDAHPSASFTYAKYQFVDATGEVVTPVEHPGWLPYSHCGRNNELADLLMFDCYISMPTVLFRRAMFDRYPLMESSDVRCGDWDYFLLCAQDGIVGVFVNEVLASIRIHGSNMSAGKEFEQSGAQLNDQLTLMERYVTPDNAARLAGCAPRIVRLLQSKVDTLMSRHPEAAAGLLPALAARMDRVLTTVERVCGTPQPQPPLVSVIIRTKDRPALLREAIESVQRQTFTHYEVVVVNDGGGDVAPLVRSLDTRGNLRLVTHAKSQGISAALNTGVREARGKYVAYLDDDDAFYPDHLRILVNSLETSEYKIAYSVAARATQVRRGDRYVTVGRDQPYGIAFDADRLLVGNYIPILCFLQARECLLEAGPFDETLDAHEDWEMWIRLSKRHAFRYVPKVTCEFTTRDDGSNVTTQRTAVFLATARVIFARYADDVRGRPDLQAARDVLIASLEQRAAVLSQPPTTASALIALVVDRLNRGDTVGAFALYDERRAHVIEETPDLREFDRLARQLRGAV